MPAANRSRGPKARSDRARAVRRPDRALIRCPREPAEQSLGVTPEESPGSIGQGAR